MSFLYSSISLNVTIDGDTTLDTPAYDKVSTLDFSVVPDIGTAISVLSPELSAACIFVTFILSVSSTNAFTALVVGRYSADFREPPKQELLKITINPKIRTIILRTLLVPYIHLLV